MVTIATTSYRCRCGTSHTAPAASVTVYAPTTTITVQLCHTCKSEHDRFLLNEPTYPIVTRLDDLGFDPDSIDVDDLDAAWYEIDEDQQYELAREDRRTA